MLSQIAIIRESSDELIRDHLNPDVVSRLSRTNL